MEGELMNTKGVAIAAAVAAMFAAGSAKAHPGHSKEKSKTVKCSGINECKGKGECGGADNACRGMNECKGQAWITVDSKKFCETKGGKVVTPHEHKKST
jgi:hypothetical protein